ncbi:MAG: GNAT family N-acetyltransferase [Deltaproteobacteria bacterium]|nr:GNAT family N-acetyltransferase [Deltaproteobacteria bacterium]
MSKAKYITADEAVTTIRKGSRIFIGSGCGEPQYLVEHIVQYANNVNDVEVIQIISARAFGGTTDKLEDHFRVKCLFVADRSAREALWEGRIEYIPMYLSRVPRLFSEGRLALDCAFIQVSPPNAYGYMSLGVSVGAAKEAISAAGLVIAQVNPAMPVTLGDSFIHISEVDALVDHEESLLEVIEPELSETAVAIGAGIARLVDDGATVHAGLGPLCRAALNAMIDKKDLGVHTDILTDDYLELIRRGVVTNRRKSINPNRIVTSYCIGRRELFDFVRMNPFVEFYPVSRTNDPYEIGQHRNMIAIHEASEMDLSGQASSSYGNRVNIGVGGMRDFIDGALRSVDGKSIIALNSTRENDTKSNIVPTLAEGANVVATKAGAHYVVTEFGAVNLEAKSIRDRATALIEIAHPKFREDLFSRAQNQGLLASSDPICLFKPVIYPHYLEKTIEVQGEPLICRPAKATDIRAIQEFFYRLNARDIQYRFLRSVKVFPRREMATMANIDYHDRMTILILKGAIGFERVIAVGRYKAGEHADLVEVDVAVVADYRRKGLGRMLMKQVLEIAESKGFNGMIAFVAHDNPNTLRLLKSVGYRSRATLNLGVFEVVLRFSEPVSEPTMEIIYNQ